MSTPENTAIEIADSKPGTGKFSQGLWVFAYGSLIWKPDFPYDDKVLGRCPGVRRSFCVWSVHHRGRPARPGLVLGLEHGGVCDGVLFYVPPRHAAATFSYLKAREQVTAVYREMFRRVDLMDGSGRSLRALCFVTNTSHVQYAGALPLNRQAQIIRRARGLSGFNLDYLNSTVLSLEGLNIHDPLLRRVQVLTGCRHKLNAAGAPRYPCFGV